MSSTQHFLIHLPLLYHLFYHCPFYTLIPARFIFVNSNLNYFQRFSRKNFKNIKNENTKCEKIRTESKNGNQCKLILKIKHYSLELTD